MKKITIEKAWDGNECETEANGRIYVSRGRWQWVVVVDGVTDSAHDLKREARARVHQLTTAWMAEHSITPSVRATRAIPASALRAFNNRHED
jgi:hypothetical protein